MCKCSNAIRIRHAIITHPLAQDNTTIRLASLTAGAARLAAPALAAAEKYMLDSSHSQIVFSYDHLGYSTGYGMF